MIAVPAIWLSAIDTLEFIIPDASVVAIGGIGVAYWSVTDPDRLTILVPLALAVFGTTWSVGELYFRRTGRDGLGIGDAKLMAAGTLCVTPQYLWLAIFLAAVGGIIFTLSVQHNSSLRYTKAVPFGPFLAYGFYLVHLLSPTT